MSAVFDRTNRLFQSLSALLEYPVPELRQAMDESTELLRTDYPASAELMSGFSAFLEQETCMHVQEVYTSTFDLQGVCCPYVGHHLFGESYKRSWFMAQLNQAYRERGFSCGSELPDHIAVVLRFLSLGSTDEFSRTLLMEGLVPAVKKMVLAFGQHSENPYRNVLAALDMLLEQVFVGLPVAMTGLHDGEMTND